MDLTIFLFVFFEFKIIDETKMTVIRFALIFNIGKFVYECTTYYLNSLNGLKINMTLI